MLIGPVVGQEPLVLLALLFVLLAVPRLVRLLLAPLAQLEDGPMLTARVRGRLLVHADGAWPRFAALVGSARLTVITVRCSGAVRAPTLNAFSSGTTTFMKLADALFCFAKMNLAEHELLVAFLMTTRTRAKAFFDAMAVISLALLNGLLETGLTTRAARLRRVLAAPATLDRVLRHRRSDQVLRAGA